MTQRYAALGNADFRRLWIGLFVSNVGTWMQNVAQSWLVYRMTGDDPVYLGILGFSFAVPMVLLPPIGGVVADRVDRVKLLYFTQGVALSVAVLLAVLAWTDALRPWHMIASSFVGASLLAFDNPTRQSLIPDLVPRDHLQNALSLGAATFTGAALIGPAIAGALLGKIGAGWLFMLNAVSFLAVMGALYAMKKPAAHVPSSASWRDVVLGGLRYARADRTLRVLLLLSATAALFGRSYQQILPVFAVQIWHSGSAAYGWLLTAGGAGALLGALVLSSIRATENHVRLMLASGAALAVSLLAFARMPSLPSGIASLVVVGAMATVFSTMIVTKIQLDVPRELRGRVIGLYTITLIGMPSLGSTAMGPVAKWIGAPLAVSVGALILAVAIGIASRRLRAA